MTAKKPSDVTEREFIEYRFSEINKKLDRMENTMNGFAFAKQNDLDGFMKEVREQYVKKESLRWIQTVVGGITIGVGVALIVGIFQLLGARI